jgi:predicted phosphodiesterase
VLLAVFSDVHGNLPALEIMLRDAGGVEGYVCLGDCVNYGPWSDECVDLVRSLPDVVYLRGNHEEYFVDGHYPGSHPVARAFFEHCLPSFTRHAAIADLPAEHLIGEHLFSHTVDDRYVYPDTVLELTGNHVIGHSHHQFQLQHGPYRLLNTGSVGQNRKYINLIDYLLLDTETMAFSPRTVRYDETVVIKEMRRRNYPDVCVAYYDGKARA